MKRIVNCCLLVLLVLGGSCKKPLDVVEVGEPPLPPEGCRIVKTIYKDDSPFIGKFTIVDPEKLTLDDGRQVQVGLISTITYRYDQQGRIIQQVDKGPSGAYNLTKQTYSPGQFIESFDSYNQSGKLVYQRIDTIRLNEQGLWDAYNKTGPFLYTYNADGQFLSNYPGQRAGIWATYKDGNQAELFLFASWTQENGQWVPIDYQYRRYEHNLQRPNLPLIRQYLGADSRNLPIKEVWEMKRSSEFPDGPVYQKTFTYLYDKRGLVRRRIVNGKSLYGGWLLRDEPYGLGVYDYEYACN